MLSIAGATKIQMEEILYDLGYSKCGEEPSTLAANVQLLFLKKKEGFKPKVKNSTKNFKSKIIKKKIFKKQK